MRCPDWLYRWIDRRNRFPFWVRLLWPSAHFCDEMDGLLIVDNVGDCFCGHCGPRTRREHRHRYVRQFFARLRTAKYTGPTTF